MYHLKTNNIPPPELMRLDYSGSLGSSHEEYSSWVMTNTRTGDTLASLARAYGVAAKDITSANNVPFDKESINQWVASRGGEQTSQEWVTFNDKTEILLPNKPRSTAKTTDAVVNQVNAELSNRLKKRSMVLNAGLIGGGVVALTVVAGIIKKKRRKK